MDSFLSISNQELQVIWLTVKVALVSTVVTLPIALFISYALARKEFKGKVFVESLISIPLVAPPVVTGYILLLLFGTNGVIGKYLSDWFGIKMAFNFVALVMASTIVSLPLSIRTMKTSFELVDPNLEYASMTLGASKRSTFFRVTLPLALPGVISGLVLSFARCLGEFGATITFAGNIIGKTQTISLMIYSNMQIPGNEWRVTRLVVISVLISLIAVVVSEIYNKKKKYLAK
ncbi:MAG: molybdate ABC transporter permease subunit [Bacteroidales bacterium]|nr:molybdate ABC transporter permease subunit [Bacteroidales bacterium]